MMHKTLVRTAVLLLAISAAWLPYDFRAMLPLPGYLARAKWLNGWFSTGRYGLNCSGFISNAHATGYLQPEQFYTGVRGKIKIISEFADKNQIDESKLIPGDVAAWHGMHVALFIRPHVWMDGDSRRGYVASYDLKKKPPSDPWFQGKVRIARWEIQEGNDISETFGRDGGCDLTKTPVCLD
jgi:hypothetical protein